MAKKKKRGGGRSMTRTAFKFLRLAALAGPGVGIAMRTDLSNEAKIGGILKAYTGYNPHDGTFNLAAAVQGWSPYVLACAFTYGVPKLTNIIRRL